MGLHSCERPKFNHDCRIGLACNIGTTVIILVTKAHVMLMNKYFRLGHSSLCSLLKPSFHSLLCWFPVYEAPAGEKVMQNSFIHLSINPLFLHLIPFIHSFTHLSWHGLKRLLPRLMITVHHKSIFINCLIKPNMASTSFHCLSYTREKPSFKM